MSAGEMQHFIDKEIAKWKQLVEQKRLERS